MKNTTFNKTIAASALIGELAFTSAAQAEASGDGLYAWSKEASKVVSSEMTYPQFAVRMGDEGTASFKVTVDRQGNILDMDLVKKNRSGVLNSAAKRAIKKTDFPDLPSNYGSDKLTFALDVNYALAYSTKEYRQLMKPGRVTSRRIASSSAPMSASIEVLDNQAE